MANGENGKQSGTDGAQASETSPVGTDKTLDSSLEEWGGSSPAPDNTRDVVGRVLKKVEPVIDFARTQAAKEENDAVEKDLNEALDFMIEPEEFKDFPKFWVKGYLEAHSAENPAFADAFNKRGENPEGWRAALSEARDKFAERAGQLPGSKVRSDVEAAKAAVSGTTNERADVPEKSEQEQAVELMQLSEGDYRRYVEREIAKAEAS
ncbi:MAG: hypothetical protein ACR2RE_05575 [Geminicoccaceae bacterium]